MSKKSIVIIGAGPGGEAAAEHAARKGARVVLVEKEDLGGLCLNRGCVPSKILLQGGFLLHAAKSFGDVLEGGPLGVRWEKLRAAKNDAVADLRRSLSQNYKRLGVDVVTGSARFIDDKTVGVTSAEGERKINFDAAILAAGSAPFFPEPFPALRDEILDSDRALSLEKIPESLVVVGGGAVGCEFACLFHELGSRVVLVEKTPALLPGEDPAVVRVLQSSFEKRGIRILTSAVVEKAVRGRKWECVLSTGETISSDEALVCVGRRPSTWNLGLEAAGVVVENGRVGVNEYLQTSRPSVYAVGDINGLSLLAHAASVQGETAVDHIFGEARPYPSHLVPRCLYTWPEVASVGEWAHTAEARGTDVKSRRFFFQGSPKARASHETEGFIQIVSEKSGEKILGAQIIGPHATELIHIFSVALKAGFTVEEMKSVVFAHPTLSEGIREALSR